MKILEKVMTDKSIGVYSKQNSQKNEKIRGGK